MYFDVVKIPITGDLPSMAWASVALGFVFGSQQAAKKAARDDSRRIDQPAGQLDGRGGSSRHADTFYNLQDLDDPMVIFQVWKAVQFVASRAPSSASGFPQEDARCAR